MDSRRIGDLLKAGREKIGMSVSDASERTRIKRSYIEAMESGNLAEFDHPVLARNFVRTYARFLKIPESEMLTYLAPDTAKADPAAPPAPVVEMEKRVSGSIFSEGNSGKRVVAAGFMALAACAIGAGLYAFLGGKSDEPAAVSDAETAAVVDTPVERPPSDTAASTAPAPMISHTADVRATQDVWALYESDGRRAEKVFRAGDKVSLTFEKKLRIRAAHGSSLKLVIDGKEISTDGQRSVMDRTFRVMEDGTVLESATPAAPR